MNAAHNRLKSKLRNGESAYGIYCCIPSVHLLEVLAKAPMDYVMFDLEHGPISLETLHLMLLALNGTAITPVVRVPTTEPHVLAHYLDLGIQSFLCSQISTPDDALDAVRATHYPPEGVRGVGAYTRAMGYRQNNSFYKSVNEQIFIAAQIESAEGIRNVAEIAKVTGIDGIYFGPQDLASDMGYLGEPERAAVVEALGTGIASALASEKTVGMTALAYPKIKEYQQAGVNMLTIGIDTAIVSNAIDALFSGVARR
ncbi:MAG: 2-dehydro-3-deoxyglucarate aldolase [Noviherbaspirillum sp.]|nr:2-dehydro-3-deoxyglucarate aldolase [Noviherbaspirillum sp.]